MLQVISRGDIVDTNSISASTNDTLLDFTVTSKMAPSPRLIVFYVREVDGEVILASINFKVAGVFDNDVSINVLNFTFIFKTQWYIGHLIY